MSIGAVQEQLQLRFCVCLAANAPQSNLQIRESIGPRLMHVRGPVLIAAANAVQDLHAYLWQEPPLGQPPAPAPAAAGHPQPAPGHQQQQQQQQQAHPVAAAWQAQWQAVHQVNVNHHHHHHHLHHHHPGHHQLDAQHPPQDLPMPVSSRQASSKLGPVSPSLLPQRKLSATSPAHPLLMTFMSAG